MTVAARLGLLASGRRCLAMVGDPYRPGGWPLGVEGGLVRDRWLLLAAKAVLEEVAP